MTDPSAPPPPSPPRAALPEVTVYTDGGADPNPGPGGWGVVLMHPASGKTEELSGGEPQTTNNRMELTAAVRALAALRARCRVELFTDSQYLRRGVTEWLPGWIARGWRRKTGELLNEDLWRQLAEETVRHEIRWRWVKGHAGDRGNERADRLASAAIREQRAARRAAGGGAAAAGAGGGGGAPGTLAQSAELPPEVEVFLRISHSRQGSGWAALVRRPAAPAAPDAGGGAAAESIASGGLAPRQAPSANALDLVAAAAVLETLPAGTRVAVHTGSDYLRHGASRWMPAWRARGWKTKEGGAVQNRALWERLAAAMAARAITWPEVKDSEPEELDRLGPLARAAALAAAGEEK
jgi:ribonuclease HI